MRLPDDIDVRYLLGGLAPDSDEPMPQGMQQRIAATWRRIQCHVPGIQFNFDFWEKCQPRRSSYPACRAVIAARLQDDSLERKMIDAIQTDYYLNAKNPSDDETLINLAVSLGLDGERFGNCLNAAETQQQLIKEIQFSQVIGAQGFPSLVLGQNGSYQRVPLDHNDAQVTLDFVG